MGIAVGVTAAICFIVGAVWIALGMWAERVPGRQTDYGVLVVLPLCAGIGYVYGMLRAGGASWHSPMQLTLGLITMSLICLVEAVRSGSDLAAVLVVVGPLCSIGCALLSWLVHTRMNREVCRRVDLSLLAISLVCGLVLSRFHLSVVRATAVVVAILAIREAIRRLKWLQS